jgi:diguanylate cyclase (GGDEF)-like protein
VLSTALLLQDRTPADPTIVRALAELGGEVFVCRSVAEVLARDPELIVVDVAAPARACAKLSLRERRAPVIAIAEPHELAAAFVAGATDCVARPVHHGELIARARAAARDACARTARIQRERRLVAMLRQLQLEKRALEQSACVDSLTGIANRRHTLALLDAEWKRSIRDGTPLSLVMLDLDSFHAFNERYTHIGGDDCLRRVCAAMVTCLRRPSDFLGRYGGEEFLAVLANTVAIGAQLVGERLRAAVEALAIEHAGATSGRVTISVGLATGHGQASGTPCDLLREADHALLSAKATGKNHVVGNAPPAPPRTPASPWRWKRFPIVIADPWFAARIPSFLTACRKDAGTLADAGRAHAYDRIRGIARRMRAAAIEHGFEHIRMLATLLEQAAQQGDVALLARATVELLEYVDHVQVTYRRRLDQIA